jgi:hypothetical protein
MQPYLFTIIIQIDEFRTSELIYYWNYLDKPCNLLFRKPHTKGLTAVVVTIENHEAADFVVRVMEKTGCKIIEKKK